MVSAIPDGAVPVSLAAAAVEEGFGPQVPRMSRRVLRNTRALGHTETDAGINDRLGACSTRGVCRNLRYLR